MAHYGIIGAGITGLTMAFRLLEEGHEVTIWEAAPTPGGAIRSHREGDWLAEAGPNSIQDSDATVGDLVRAVGLENRLQEASTKAKRRYIVRYHKPQLVPNSAWTAITTPLFSFSAKLGIFAEPFRKVPDANAGSTPDPLMTDESLASFVRRRLGDEFLDYAINPLVGGIYAGNPERLSVRYAFPKIHALEVEFGSLIKGAIGRMKQLKRSGEKAHKKRVLSFPNGLSELTEALAARMGDRLLLSHKVVTARRHPEHGYVVSASKVGPKAASNGEKTAASSSPNALSPDDTTVKTFTPDASTADATKAKTFTVDAKTAKIDSSTQDATTAKSSTPDPLTAAAPKEVHVDKLIYAGTAFGLAKIQFEGFALLPDPLLPEMVYAPVASVSLGFRREDVAHKLDGFGVLVPEKEKMGILGCLFMTSIFEGRAPAGHVLLTTFVGGMRQPANASLPENELLGLVRENLADLLGVKGKPKFVHVTKWKKAIPQYEIGFASYLERMQAIEAANPGFAFAGNYKTGISLDNCVKSGWEVISS